jgi:hypothetical protein
MRVELVSDRILRVYMTLRDGWCYVIVLNVVRFIIVWNSYYLTNHLTTYNLDPSFFLSTTISPYITALSSSCVYSAGTELTS